MSLLRSLVRNALATVSTHTKSKNRTLISHRFICASRLSKSDFWSHSPLGKSLSTLYNSEYCDFSIAYSFKDNICSYYNEFISCADGEQILIFVMDHIGVIDPSWREKLDLALGQFNLVGIRGNSKLTDEQPTWWFETFTSEPNCLSGGARLETVNGYAESNLGYSPLACKVLEPSFIAIRAKNLYNAEIDFDPDMGQSFFALDFCRSAALAGLSIGTWPIHIADACSLITPSNYSENWSDYFLRYRAKWLVSDTSK